MAYQFGAIIEKSGKRFGVFFPDLLGCVTVGDTIDEAKARAVEVLTFHLRGMLQGGYEIPPPSPLDQLVVDPAVNEVARVMVAASILDAGGGNVSEGILEGLDEALSYVRGEKTGAREAVVMIERESDDAPAKLKLISSRSPGSSEWEGADDEPDDEVRESYGYRSFLYEADGTLRRVPLRVADGLARGTDSLPQYANQRLRGLYVVIWIEGGQPQLIERVEPFIWPFDEDGYAQANLAKMAMTAWETHDAIERERRAKPGLIADIKPQIARRRWEQESLWKPTDDEIKRITAIIFPEMADGPAERPRSVTGTAKRRLPMSFEAKRALDDCWRPAHDITSKIERLGDKDLKAFMQGAEQRLDAADPVTTAFWKGVIGTAEKELEVRAARKSSKGKWFAAVEAFIAEPGARGLARSSTIEFRECDGRVKAVAAAREMLAKHAVNFDVGISIEARLYPEIEWAEP
jgi:predicted RNase H-like HicB family nuclease